QLDRRPVGELPHDGQAHRVTEREEDVGEDQVVDVRVGQITVGRGGHGSRIVVPSYCSKILEQWRRTMPRTIPRTAGFFAPLTASGALASIVVRRWEPRRAMAGGALVLAAGAAVTLVALTASATPLFFAGTDRTAGPARRAVRRRLHRVLSGVQASGGGGRG